MTEKTSKNYDSKLKSKAITLAKSGISRKTIALELNINMKTLSRWIIEDQRKLKNLVCNDLNNVVFQNYNIKID